MRHNENDVDVYLSHFVIMVIVRAWDFMWYVRISFLELKRTDMGTWAWALNLLNTSESIGT